MMQSLKMKKDQIQELEKRVDGIERKIDDELKLLRDYKATHPRAG